MSRWKSLKRRATHDSGLPSPVARIMQSAFAHRFFGRPRRPCRTDDYCTEAANRLVNIQIKKVKNKQPYEGEECLETYNRGEKNGSHVEKKIKRDDKRLRNYIDGAYNGVRCTVCDEAIHNEKMILKEARKQWLEIPSS
ncbi:hypothetical protein ILUMI_26416 [Ignelater luminosus]|uniref:Uncharacterized protein n=1 Tax=Ignelater luminosus TaxID=2038154 RepID=A0A8K0FYP0_IGNLU|nr:hypothetical protein ILUMI_26416 [Ignelater luminosus]